MSPDQETILTPLNDAPRLREPTAQPSSPSCATPRPPDSAFAVTRSFAVERYRRLQAATGIRGDSARTFPRIARLLAIVNRLLPRGSKAADSSSSKIDGSFAVLTDDPTDEASVSVDPVTRLLNAPRPAKVRFRFETIREFLPFFKRIWKYIKPYKTRFIFGELAGIGFAFFNMLIPLMLKVVLDHTTPAQMSKAQQASTSIKPAGGGVVSGILEQVNHLAEGRYGVLLICLSVPAIMILRGLFDYLNNYNIAWVSLRVLGDMRKQLFAHINSQSLDFFHTNRAGELISRVTNDTRVGQTALALVGSDLIKQPLTVITCVIALLNLDFRFTLISLTLFPLCMVPVAIYGKRIRKNGRMEEEQAGAMTVILTETFAGIRVILRARGLPGRAIR